jgi:hypothetical protein
LIKLKEYARGKEVEDGIKAPDQSWESKSRTADWTSIGSAWDQPDGFLQRVQRSDIQ